MTGIKSRIVTVALLCAMFPLAGCTGQQDAAEVVSIAGTGVAALETSEGKLDLAAKITADSAAASQAIANFTKGSPSQIVIYLLTTFEDDLNLLPISAGEDAVIDIAIGTVEQIIESFQKAAPATVASPAVAKSFTNASLVSAAPHRKVHLAKTPKNAKEFAKQWNTEAGKKHLPTVAAK